MELTNEIFEKNGFTCNHPERVLRNYNIHGKDYHIKAEQRYIPKTNILGYTVEAWKVDSSDTIIKRTYTLVITTVEELNSIINLTDIDLLIYC